MRRTALHLDAETAKDVAYPTSAPVDPVFPCRTMEPLTPLLGGVVSPGLWSRLRGPLGAALELLWEAGGLGSQPAPHSWACLHYGRIVVNAHGWELLRSALHGVEPDASLVPPSDGRITRLLDRIRGSRAPARRRRQRRRTRRAAHVGDRGLENASRWEPIELDLFELARGPLDDRTWMQILVPWLAEALLEWGDHAAEMRTARALALERRFTRLLGERLVERGMLSRPEDAAYLCVEERLGAVNDPAGSWALHLDARIERVREFLELRVPSVFWGAPRPQRGSEPDGTGPPGPLS